MLVGASMMSLSEATIAPHHQSISAPATIDSVPDGLALQVEPLTEKQPLQRQAKQTETEDRRNEGHRWKPQVKPHIWKYIVLHHTATKVGSVASIHAAHRQRKDAEGNPWLGIGYHFVIGNGKGMPDGAIEPTFRWRKQLHGAHAGAKNFNSDGIGIVLVGNFENDKPTAAQLLAVKRLVAYLKAEFAISSEEIVGHGDVKATACPGRHFPLQDIVQVSSPGSNGASVSASDKNAAIQMGGKQQP